MVIALIIYLSGILMHCILLAVAIWFDTRIIKTSVTFGEIFRGLLCSIFSWAAVLVFGIGLFEVIIESHGKKIEKFMNKTAFATPKEK